MNSYTNETSAPASQALPTNRVAVTNISNGVNHSMTVSSHSQVNGKPGVWVLVAVVALTKFIMNAAMQHCNSSDKKEIVGVSQKCWGVYRAIMLEANNVLFKKEAAT